MFSVSYLLESCQCHEEAGTLLDKAARHRDAKELPWGRTAS